MIDPKKIATLGIGFGSLAICTIGLLPSIPTSDYGGSGSSRGIFKRYRPDWNNPKEDIIIPIPEVFVIEDEEEEEEQVVAILLVELFRSGIL
jgi:hypothetical protein